MKYTKLFEQFIVDSDLVIESQDADINMAKTYIDEKSKGKHCLYFQFMTDQTAQKYAKEWGLTADGGRVMLACSNDKAELNSIKKDYLNKISSDSKRVFKQYGIGLMVEALDEELIEGTIAYDKVAKALYGTTSQSEIPAMSDFLKIKSGDDVTVIAVPLAKGSELFSFVQSLSKGSAWMSEKNIFGSKTMWGAFKGLSQDEFEELKSQFPSAEIADLDDYNPKKSKSKAIADGKKLSKVENVEDTYTKY
jgi:hypothetical protein